MFRYPIGLLFSILCCVIIGATGAAAQGTVQQSGPVTYGHAPVWFGNGSIGDSGAASGSGYGLNEWLLIARSFNGTQPFANAGSGPLGTNACDYDGPPTLGAYHYLCFSPNAQGGALIDYGSGGGASTLPFSFDINGEIITLGGSGWLSTIFDAQFGSAVGDILCRGSSGWQALTSGTSGYFLEADGSSGCPAWTAVAPGNVNVGVAGDIAYYPNSAAIVSDSGVSLSGLQADIALKAPLASAALTGTPTAPTASTLTNSTQIATTAYVQANLSSATGSVGNATVTTVASSGTITVSAGSQTISQNEASVATTTYVLPPATSFPTCPTSPKSCPVIIIADTAYNVSTAAPMIVTASGGINVGQTTTFLMPFPGQSQKFTLLGLSWLVN